MINNQDITHLKRCDSYEEKEATTLTANGYTCTQKEAATQTKPENCDSQKEIAENKITENESKRNSRKYNN